MYTCRRYVNIALHFLATNLLQQKISYSLHKVTKLVYLWDHWGYTLQQIQKTPSRCFWHQIHKHSSNIAVFLLHHISRLHHPTSPVLESNFVEHFRVMKSQIKFNFENTQLLQSPPYSAQLLLLLFIFVHKTNRTKWFLAIARVYTCYFYSL